MIVGELLGEVVHAKVLDVGCGDGSISRQLLGAENELTLLDLSPHMLELAETRAPPQHRARMTLVQEDIAYRRGPHEALVGAFVLCEERSACLPRASRSHASPLFC